MMTSRPVLVVGAGFSGVLAKLGMLTEGETQELAPRTVAA